MDDKEIIALAREYAEECIDPYGFSKETYEEMVEEKAENVAYVLRWLSIRYCIMEKEAVAKLLKEHHKENRGTDKGSRAWFFYNGRLDLLKSFFPDIRKEVEG